MNAKRGVPAAALAAFLLPGVLSSLSALAWADGGTFIKPLHDINSIVSTVPANGDQNPYGVAVVRRKIGGLAEGNILVSNFNNSANQQGTGTTIMQIAPKATAGTASVFAQIDAASLPGPCPGGIGLTTALVVLRSGWVIVGSLPTSDGTAATAQAGCLLVLDSAGHVVETIVGDPINGPWDMTAVEGDDQTTLFVTNVLNGTVAGNGSVVNQGTVVRIVLSVGAGNMPPQVLSETVIGTGFPERTDPNALVIGPTGVGLGEDGTLYIADTLSNRIQAIANALSIQSSAGTGTTVSSVRSALNGPLGLAIAPNGNILTVNGNDGKMVETTPQGDQVAVKPVDTTHIGAGTLFGLAVEEGGGGVYFVNDGNNMLDLLH